MNIKIGDIEDLIDGANYHTIGIRNILKLIPDSKKMIDSIIVKAITAIDINEMKEIHYSNDIFTKEEKDFIKTILIYLRSFKYKSLTISFNQSYLYLKINGYFVKKNDSEKSFLLEYDKYILNDNLGSIIEDPIKSVALKHNGIIDINLFTNRMNVHKTLYTKQINSKLTASVTIHLVDEKELFDYIKSKIEKDSTIKVISIPSKYFYIEFHIDSKWNIVYVDDITVDSLLFNIHDMQNNH